MLDAVELATMTYDVFRLHSEHAKTPEKRFRRFDGKTPFGVHPVLGGMLILHEELLPEKTRETGAKAFFGQDFKEDTDADLPRWAKEPEVERLIDELTFTEDENKFDKIWERSEEAILLSFYDNVINLMCVGKVKQRRLTYCKRKIREHMKYIKSRWGRLEIVRLAEGLLK